MSELEEEVIFQEKIIEVENYASSFVLSAEVEKKAVNLMVISLVTFLFSHKYISIDSASLLGLGVKASDARLIGCFLLLSQFFFAVLFLKGTYSDWGVWQRKRQLYKLKCFEANNLIVARVKRLEEELAIVDKNTKLNMKRRESAFYFNGLAVNIRNERLRLYISDVESGNAALNKEDVHVGTTKNKITILQYDDILKFINVRQEFILKFVNNDKNKLLSDYLKDYLSRSKTNRDRMNNNLKSFRKIKYKSFTFLLAEFLIPFSFFVFVFLGSIHNIFPAYF